MTGEQVRWGLENLNLTAARIKELGFEGVLSPIKVSCADHEGTRVGRIQTWDGKKWKLISDWITADDSGDRPDGQGRRGQVRGREEDHARLRDQLMRRPRRSRHPQLRRRRRRRLAATAAAADAAILSVNNIEVVYSHVILVLKGVSLQVPKGGIVALLGANGAGKTTTLKAISNLLHAERGEVTKGSIVVRRRRGAVAVAERTGAARLHPGDGGPALLRPSHHRGESPDRRLHPHATAPARSQRDLATGLFLFPAPEGAPRARSPATPPAASSRCARSAAR